MPASSDAGAPPSVPLSFSNNFWGRDDGGVDPLLTRVQNAKTTCDELRAFYKARAELEEDYARKLLAICRKPLGSVEMGTLRTSLDVARGETEVMGKQHAEVARQMRAECEEPLAAFSGGMKERRKIVQTGVERLLKTKQQQTAHVNKCRDRYEQDCLRIKGYLAQGHMVMGQEERKNKAKLEKTQINMASNSQEYEAAVKVLEETIGRWNKEWKAACDKFQDLEEERLDFTKSSLWAFTNIASTVCVTDDTSCEKIRLALENCEVEKDIAHFIKVCGTSQEIPDPPRYINFAKGDCDSASEVSEDDNYSVAQFHRTINPAFRSSSPNNTVSEPDQSREPSEEPQEKVPVVTGGANSGRPAPLNYKQAEPNVPPNYSPSQHGEIPKVPHNQYPTDGMTMYCRRDDVPSRATQSDLSSNTRPPSRDSQSDYSNPSSFTSAEPTSGAVSPTKQYPVNGVQLPGMETIPEQDRSVQKKRSGFFAKSPFNANSPFRRKSKKEIEHPAKNGGWTPGSTRPDLQPSVASASSIPTQSSPTRSQPQPRQPQVPFNRHAGISAPEGEEPADPRATFQLNVGPNVLDVASPDSDSHQSTPRASAINTRRGTFAPPAITAGNDDPIAQALANLKQSSGGLDMSKRASLRQPVDAYHRVRTPAPDQVPATRPDLISRQAQDIMAVQRGTPPPSYDGRSGRAQSALGVPQPAHTAREMRERTQNWGMGSSVSAPGGRPGSSMGGNRPPSRDGRRSPGPPTTDGRDGRRSPGPPAMSRDGRRSPGPLMMSRDGRRSPAPGAQGMVPRAISPQPQHAMVRARSPAPPMNHSRQGSANSMQMQAPMNSQASGGQGGSGRSRQGMMPNARPTSSYGGGQHYDSSSFDGHRGRGVDPGVRRERSKSVGVPGMTSGSVHIQQQQQQRQQPAPPRPQQNHPPQASANPHNPLQRSASPNPYARPPRANTQPQPQSQPPIQQYQSQGQAHQRPHQQARQHSYTQSQPQQPHANMEVQLAPAGGDLARYEAPPPSNICFMARACYTYVAAIPEELSFSKNDTLAVLRLQDDGWWEAEVHQSAKGGPTGGIGLVPSNYLSRL